MDKLYTETLKIIKKYDVEKDMRQTLAMIEHMKSKCPDFCSLFSDEDHRLANLIANLRCMGEGGNRNLNYAEKEVVANAAYRALAEKLQDQLTVNKGDALCDELIAFMMDLGLY